MGKIHDALFGTILDETKAAVLRLRYIQDRRIREINEMRDKLSPEDTNRRQLSDQILVGQINKKKLDDMLYFIDKRLRSAFFKGIPSEAERMLKTITVDLTTAEIDFARARTKIHQSHMMLENLCNSLRKYP